ncbi:hypothetical protein ACROYT_G022054 [Oculina patagonica]
MSDNIPLDVQRAYTDGEYYNLDLFSYVQPPVYGNSGSLNQLIMYITRALENSDRLAFMQAEQIKHGMIKVYSNSFCWQKTQGSKLIAKLIMEDFHAKQQVDRRKIDEMKLAENKVFTLPSCNASIMKLVGKLMTVDKQVLLETGELNVKLSMLQGETRAGVEHDYCTSQPTEQEIPT